jgi:hypothetical protein
VFVVGAVLKAADVNLFAVQVSFYGVLSNPAWIDAAALWALFTETALGCALILGARLRGLTHAATLALLAVFTALIGYGWAFHGLEDCGCFGKLIEMSPRVSIGKNVALAILCMLAWQCADASSNWGARAIRYGIPFWAAVAATGYAYAHLEAAPKSDAGVFSQFVFEEEGVTYDLGTGEYFVPILNMTCEHCMASVAKTNVLAQTPGFPPIVALCYEDEEGDLANFQAQTAPEFPLHPLGAAKRLFFSLIGKAPPRFYLIRDGKPVKFWDEQVPSAEDVLKAVGNPSVTGG